MRPHLVFFTVAMLALGIVCLAFPKAVRVLATRALELAPFPGADTVKAFVQSNAYLWNVRAVGLLGLVVGLFLVFATVRGN